MLGFKVLENNDSKSNVFNINNIFRFFFLFVAIVT